MSKDVRFFAVGAMPRPSKFVIGYDGITRDPTRRVSVCPDELIYGALSSTPEARGVLFTVFCRFWRDDAAPIAEHIRLECRLSKRRFAKIIGELVFDELVREASGLLYPTGPFGPEPLRAPAERRAPRRPREMPRDWLELREAVFERDGYGCVYCGSGRDLHCDHVVPIALGGSNNMENLATASAPCNLSKGMKTVAEWRPDLAEAWQR